METTTTHEAVHTTDDEERASEEQNEAKKRDKVMTKLFNETASLPQQGDLLEGPVIAADRGQVFIDLPPYGTGVIYGREFINARDILRKVNIGDKIAAKVVDPENKYGHIELSLKEARQALVWSEAEEAIKNKQTFELPVKEANKGGLILEWQGIQGFLPASQLTAEHYPRVEDGDKDQIFEELKKLVGTKLSVCIIAADPKEGKLIFSEKDVEEQEKTEVVSNYNIGDEIEGEVTGIVDFGVFVKIEEGLEGLVHISEIDWGLVEDPRAMFSVGDTVRARIIDITNGKVSLSIKALKENPWKHAADLYEVGDTVRGVIIKHNKHGALASIEEGVAGLIHVSEFDNNTQQLREELELGKTYPLKITYFDPKDQRMTLSYKQADPNAVKTAETQSAASAKAESADTETESTEATTETPAPAEDTETPATFEAEATEDEMSTATTE